MTSIEIGIASLVGIFGLVYAGLWIPFALLVCSFLGVWFIKGSPILAGKLMALSAQSAISSEVFAVIPLFIMLGFLVGAAGIGKDALDLSERAFRKLPAGSGLGVVGANTIFAAMTGVSIASAAVFTRISFGPMVSAGYRRKFVLGLVAGSSVLGMLIPPSLLLILFGILADQSVGDLFIAGIIPGLILAFSLGALVIGMARLAPSLVWSPLKANHPTPGTSLKPNNNFVPLFVLLASVLGGIATGFFTTQEAAAFGCLVAFGILFIRKRATRGTVSKVLGDTAAVTASLCFMIIAAQVYARMLSLSGVPSGLSWHSPTSRPFHSS
jgi:C4-dicarboxylate transporter DctM subunit